MSKYKTLSEYLQIMLGATMLACAISVFYEPNGLVTGGVSGLGIIIQTVSSQYIGFSIPLWISNTILNLPLFVIGAKALGFKFLKRTIFATAFLSFALFFTNLLPTIQGIDHPLASVFGGAIAGIGLGLVFKCMATTGGSDLAASILHKYFKHISISKLMFVIDSIVIAIGFFVFGATNAMYAIISVFISSKIIGGILEGLSFAKVAFIVSEKYEAISDELLKKLERGATGLNGKGMFTKSDKNVLFCVVSTKEVIELKEIVSKTDPNAFVIVTDAREVLGEGFQSI